MRELGVAGRFAALGGASAGLAAAPFVSALVASPELVVVGAVALGALAAARPRGAGRVGRLAWLILLALALALLGLAIGLARVAAIDRGALSVEPGRVVSVAGHVAAVPRRSGGKLTVRIETPDGRLLLEAPEPVPELPVGRAVRATGTVREPRPWEAGWLRTLGIRAVVSTPEIELRPGHRGGAVAVLDEARARAEQALGRGTDPARAALLRGFVLGQDDRIDEQTVEEFRRSGLSHLLAVSGQNVLLLAVLAWPLLAVLGLRLRARLLVTLALIAVYVPVAGAGPSIQRAGVMGAAGVLAGLAGRPRSSAYALLLASAITLTLNPRVTSDPGWQLSFAAVVGIALWARPLRARLLPADRRGVRAPFVRTALADGLAVTFAATLATAPLIAHRFGVLSIASLPANLLALPAVAPVMWLGMLAGLAGQVPGLPVEALTWLAGTLAAYIAQIARWLSAPSWAQVDLSVGQPLALAGAYGGLAAAVAITLRWLGRRTTLRTGRSVAAAVAVPLIGAAIAVAGTGLDGEDDRAPVAPGALRVTVLDVGQGDSILLEPGDGAPVLVDAGPPQAGVAAMLDQRGVDRLGALVATHPESDHVGGVAEVMDRVPTDRLVYAAASRDLLAAGTAGNPARVSVAAGSSLRSGSLHLRVLWPPAERLRGPAEAGDDPNELSLVMLARWHDFDLLLVGDAEAELAPIDPGPIEALKVAHHGSEDAGLGGLLERAAPQLALLSVGADNPFGHPSPATLTELEDAGVAVARTDLSGSLVIEVTRRGFALDTGD